MTWIDITAIIIWILFVAVGARAGSLWLGGCLVAGFTGAFLADIYSPALAQMLGGFTGATFLAMVLLFVGGLAAVLLPAYLISKFGSILFLGIIDSAVGLVAGALTGLIALSLVFLLLVPHFPAVEKSKAWKKSAVVKPFHGMLEQVFQSPAFHPRSIKKKIKKLKKAKKKASPLLKKIKKLTD